MASDPKPGEAKPAEPEKVWYEAVCHCKAVKYKCLLPAQLKVNRCNCTACTKFGYLLVYPRREEVEWLSGFDKLKNYRFGANIQDHKFCSECGSHIGIDSMGVNVKYDCYRMNIRLFKDLDLDGPRITYVDSDGRYGYNAEFNDPERM